MPFPEMTPEQKGGSAGAGMRLWSASRRDVRTWRACCATACIAAGRHDERSHSSSWRASSCGPSSARSPSSSWRGFTSNAARRVQEMRGAAADPGRPRPRARRAAGPAGLRRVVPESRREGGRQRHIPSTGVEMASRPAEFNTFARVGADIGCNSTKRAPDDAAA